jgi:hypothetical protein
MLRLVALFVLAGALVEVNSIYASTAQLDYKCMATCQSKGDTYAICQTRCESKPKPLVKKRDKK